MQQCEIEALVAEAVRDADLRPEEIPSIDLYLDQITCLVAEKHRQGAKHFEERALTKTMINNYSKDGLLSPIKGKKYSKEHILQMLLVYEMKNTLSIGEIKRVLQSIYALPEYSPQLLERVYLRYLALKDAARPGVVELVRLLMREQDAEGESEEEILSLILGMTAMSSYLKSAAQILLAAHYPAETEDADAEKEQKDEAKQRRAEQKAEQKAEKRAAKEPKKQKEGEGESV
ncbi:MAG: DUF1836 domain-containing protein [Clostridia bacterium]|nr:DUF1836 domain-containing protein [Clostridia bacterium]